MDSDAVKPFTIPEVIQILRTTKKQQTRNAFRRRVAYGRYAFCSVGVIQDELRKKYPKRFYWPAVSSDGYGRPLKDRERNSPFHNSPAIVDDYTVMERLPLPDNQGVVSFLIYQNDHERRTFAEIADELEKAYVNS